MTNPINSWLRRIRDTLRRHGSPEHAQGVQRFFKEEIQAHGWYTADLRKLAATLRREITSDGGPELLLAVADRLFSSRVLEEKGLAVFLLEKSVKSFGPAEFKLFESWLARIHSWADHDGLVMCLIGPMLAADRRRVARVFRWARSRNRWHRRAAAVALIHAARRRQCFKEIVRLSGMLLDDQDDMVQKGLGWLLRETAKADPAKTVPYLMTIRDRAPRLVLRTACEALPPQTRSRILARPAH